MTSSGKAIKPFGTNYHQEFLNYGKIKIKEFSNLNSILNNFEEFSEENYDKNIFLVLASRAQSDVFLNGQPNLNAQKDLELIEQALKEIDISKLKKEKRETIIQRIKSFDGELNCKIFQELEFFVLLQQIETVTDILYDNFSGSNHDFRCKIMGNEINIELTALGKNIFTEILEQGLDESAKEIIEKIPDKMILILHIKTDMLLTPEGKCDVTFIKNKLLGSFNHLMPLILVQKNHYCFIETNFGDSNNSLIDSKDIFPFFNEFGERLMELLKSPSGVEYLKNTKISVLKETPITSFIYGDGNSSLVEIQPEMMYPSVSETLRKKSITRQMRNLIKDKLNKNQLKNQPNPLLAIKLNDILFFHYEIDEDYFGLEHLEELKTLVEDTFYEVANTSILGVLFYDNTLRKSRFIANPLIKGNEKIIKYIQSLRNSM